MSKALIKTEWAMRAVIVFCLLVIVQLTGCASESNFQVKRLAKSDVDLVADLHRQSVSQLLQRLNGKLYRRNPIQLAKAPGHTIASRWQQLSDAALVQTRFAELGGRSGIDAMQLAFEPSFSGDRVFALMAGLNDMLAESYDYKSEYFILDQLDEDKLFKSAHNVEVLVWMLRTRLDSRGKPLIISNNLHPDAINLSFERLFGKLIAHQEMMAAISGDKDQRTINALAHGIMSMTFVPL